jgi:hypothetical protein
VPGPERPGPAVPGAEDQAVGTSEGEGRAASEARGAGGGEEGERDWPWGDAAVEVPKGENGRPVPPKEQSFEEDELFEQTLFDDHESNAEERS